MQEPAPYYTAEYSKRVFTARRRLHTAVYAVCVCLSVTLVYCVETTEFIIK